jgi:hypothetical protein
MEGSRRSYEGWGKRRWSQWNQQSSVEMLIVSPHLLLLPYWLLQSLSVVIQFGGLFIPVVIQCCAATVRGGQCKEKGTREREREREREGGTAICFRICHVSCFPLFPSPRRAVVQTVSVIICENSTPFLWGEGEAREQIKSARQLYAKVASCSFVFSHTLLTLSSSPLSVPCCDVPAAVARQRHNSRFLQTSSMDELATLIYLVQNLS